MSIHLFILAGGSGTRLWPLSKTSSPKQFLKLSSPYSLLQQTLLRFCHIPSCSAYVLTATPYKLQAQEHLKELGLELPLILEPSAKNTLPAVCHALSTLKIPDEDFVLVLPTDHVFDEVGTIIDQVIEFQKTPTPSKMLIFGAKPDYPETGYGYILPGEVHHEELFFVDRFIEKPTKEKASSLVDSQAALWNTGLLLFQVATLKRLLKENAPDFFSFVQGNLSFDSLPSVSLDYGLLEKTRDLLVYPSLHKWVDLGSWDRLYHYLVKDQNQNVLIGDVQSFDTGSSLIMGSNKKIVTLGLSDMLIIDTDEVLFIGKKSRFHEMKELRSLILESDGVASSAEESPK